MSSAPLVFCQSFSPPAKMSYIREGELVAEGKRIGQELFSSASHLQIMNFISCQHSWYMTIWHELTHSYGMLNTVAQKEAGEMKRQSVISQIWRRLKDRVRTGK